LIYWSKISTCTIENRNFSSEVVAAIRLRHVQTVFPTTEHACFFLWRQIWQEQDAGSLVGRVLTRQNGATGVLVGINPDLRMPHGGFCHRSFFKLTAIDIRLMASTLV
jgi:hypothetical protein